MNKYELNYWINNHLVAGIDEVGRGPMAGPLVVALVILPINYNNQNINDSKVLSDKKRRLIFEQLLEDALYIDLEIVNEVSIDSLNIYQATKLAMEALVTRTQADYYLVDAMPINSNKATKSLIKGDRLSVSIAAASIIAKVVRDDIMLHLDKAYPNYGFKNHKGYPTKLHKEMLIKYGALDFHRKSYKPVADTLVDKNKF